MTALTTQLIESVKEMRYAMGYGPRKLSRSRDKWLHRTTQELLDNDDPRVPRTIDEGKNGAASGC
jgi:hypothetical protein